MGNTVLNRRHQPLFVGLIVLVIFKVGMSVSRLPPYTGSSGAPSPLRTAKPQSYPPWPLPSKSPKLARNENAGDLFLSPQGDAIDLVLPPRSSHDRDRSDQGQPLLRLNRNEDDGELVQPPLRNQDEDKSNLKSSSIPPNFERNRRDLLEASTYPYTQIGNGYYSNAAPPRPPPPPPNPFSPFSTNDALDDKEFWRQVNESYWEYCRRHFPGYGCETCHRDKVCQYYSDCCPDVYVKRGYKRPDHFVSETVQCSGIVINGNYLPQSYDPLINIDDRRDLITIARCPTATDEFLMNKCETKSTVRWDLTLPVTDRNTFVTYKNRYCAQCHSAANVAPWEAVITIKDHDALKNSTSPAELYQTVLNSANALKFSHPQGLENHARMCLSVTKEYSRCNETGEWGYYDANVQRACSIMRAPVYDTERGMRVTYKNPFCLLCNTHLRWTEMQHAIKPYAGFGSHKAPLLILLNFNDEFDDQGEGYDAPANSKKCIENQFYDKHTMTQTAPGYDPTCPSFGAGWIIEGCDLNEKCRRIICASGRHLIGSSNECQDPQVTNMYGLQICLRTTAAANGHNREYSNWSENHQDHCHGPAHLGESKRFSFPDSNLFVHKVFFKDPVDRNSFDETLFSKTVSQDILDEAMLINGTTTENEIQTVLNCFCAALGVNLTHCLHRMFLYQNNLLNVSVAFSPTCSSSVYQTLFYNNTFDIPSVVIYRSDDVLVHEQIFSGKFSEIFEEAIYLPVFKPLVCPSVELSLEEYRYDRTTNELVLQYAGKGRVALPNYYITETYTALVCLSQYRQAVGGLEEDVQNSRPAAELSGAEKPNQNHVLYWVSLISTIISLVFLAISFVIYCLLSSLRSIAGINNLILIVAMFMAQLLLCIGSEVAMTDWLCQVMGVATHFFWLAVTFAQNACTFHMFYSLSFPLHSYAAMGSPGLMKKKYAGYVLVLAVSFVVVTLTWQFGAEGRSGYGGRHCFISEAVVRIAMFAVPLAFTVILNIIMFVVTVVCMRKKRRVESTGSNRVNILLYLKLSVFTGAMWMFGFLASLLNSVSLGYVFVVFQGCQGLFIFLAFLAKKTVFVMLSENMHCSNMSV